MSIATPEPRIRNGYPTTDGRPMAETDIHRKLMMALIEALEDRYAADQNVYVSGNLLLFYEEGNKRRHVSPDVFVVFGVPKQLRPNYLLWEEGRGPNVVIELTSSSTRKEDTNKKYSLYQDVLKVPEYFLFDPFGDYLKPRFQGYRLVQGKYSRMQLKDGRLRSQQLRLILEPDGKVLRFVDPETGQRLPTRVESRHAEELKRHAVELERRAAELARESAEQQLRSETKARLEAEAEIERLRAELARRKPHNGKNGR
jgi:Uma2 family endonuclease